MFWKIYFWIVLVMLIASMFLESPYHGNVGIVVGIVSMIIQIISAVGLYGYVYKKQFFSKYFWKIIFLIAVVELIAETIYVVFEDAVFLGVEGMILVTATTFVIMYPLMVGLYRYGFKK